MTTLNGTQDTFDLKIVGNPVEFDYIVNLFTSKFSGAIKTVKGWFSWIPGMGGDDKEEERKNEGKAQKVEFVPHAASITAQASGNFGVSIEKVPEGYKANQVDQSSDLTLETSGSF